MLPVAGVCSTEVSDDGLLDLLLLQHTGGTIRKGHHLNNNSNLKLKLGSFFLCYVLGYCIETTSFFVTSSTGFILLLATGIIATLVQSWFAWLHLRWGDEASYSIVDFFLWFESSILCFHGGYFCASGVADYLLGSQPQLVDHMVREVVCVGLCVVCTRALDFDSNRSNREQDPQLTLPLLLSQQQEEVVVAGMESKNKTSRDRKLKLGSMTLSYILGYSTHMTAVLVMLTRTSSFTCNCLLVGACVIATLIQSCITSMHFDYSTSSSNSVKNSKYYWEFFLWMVASVLSALSGFSCAWIVTDYWLGFQGRATYHMVLEILCITKFLLLAWAICYNERSSATGPMSSSSQQQQQQQQQDSDTESDCCENMRLMNT